MGISGDELLVGATADVLYRCLLDPESGVAKEIAEGNMTIGQAAVSAAVLVSKEFGKPYPGGINDIAQTAVKIYVMRTMREDDQV